MQITREYSRTSKAVLHYGEALPFLKTLPSGSVDLVITSPPYCMGKDYEKTSKVHDFTAAHERIFPEMLRVTAPTANICWQVGYHVDDGTVTPLDYHFHTIACRNGLVLRNRIVWTYGHGLHCSSRFSGRHEVILWYSKAADYKFNLDAVRVPQKYPGKKFYKGNRRGEFSGNKLGKNPSDVWDIPNVKANHIEKTSHPCQFPVALALRTILALSDKGDTVLDPFMGSGTTGVAALTVGRRFFGAELKKKYWNISHTRCAEALAGDAKFRPLDRPIWTPGPGDAVATPPADFVWNQTFSTPHGKEKTKAKSATKPK